MQARDVVITAVGVTSAFGLSTETFFDGLESNQTGVRDIQNFETNDFPVKVAAEVPLPVTQTSWLEAQLLQQTPETQATWRPWLTSKYHRDRKFGFALLAALEAWKQAGCDESCRSAWLSFALGLERAFLEDFVPLLNVQKQIDFSKSQTQPKTLQYRGAIDICTDALQDLFKLQGRAVSHVSACAAGTLSVAYAAAAIRRGQCEIALAGGSDSMVNPLGVGGMWRLQAPSPRDELDACRPFDKARDGLVMGEGAAAFVLESREHAQRRGARILARIVGWGSTQDGYRTTAPRPDGSQARKAMQRALKKANLSPRQIGYINAHGTGTPLNDPSESQAILDVFGKEYGAQVPVSSIKGAVGHLMAASGAIELAACLMVFGRSVLPGTCGLKDIDEKCPINVLKEPKRDADGVEYVLSNSFGFGGQNASIILGREQEQE